ncbi:B-cell receptor CD22-like [Archocentrus centrarchus]|uniref:B-cell receptor CD22-like n=1 Tax=Archocentrus centrarchus TaxID=63155 RepID=UPI0011EA4940|nr:B-cell receptor CD22-like [Archocentrus centrarchus]
MLCDLRADEVQEMRAAMSSTAAASGVVLFLLSLPVVQGRNGWSVDYTSTQICALKGSTVTIGCSFTFPYSENGRTTTVNKKVWFVKGNDYDPDDLKTDSAYAGRLMYDSYWWSCTLKIRELRESDSAVYKFRFETNQEGGSYTGSPGVTLTVTALHVDTSSYYNWAKLTCQSSCRLPNRPSFIWYKNGQKIYGQTNMYLYPEIPNPSDSYSCAASGHEALPSPSVCVQGDSCNRVNYSNRNICAFKGSSVDISCTYNSYQQIESKSWFYSGRGSEDLSKVSQHEGRVEVTDTERGRSTLRIRDLRESDSAEYHFKFKTQSFEWTSSLPGTTLTVTDVQVQVTGRRLDCVTRCNPYVSSYVWYIDGKQVDGASSASYEISNSYDYKNSYSCALKGFEDFHSPLIYAPKVVSAVANYSAEMMEGSSVTLTCSSDANPAANYTWYKEQTVLSRQQQVFIRSMNSSDSGEYHCTAENELGRRTSESISVDMKYAPKVVSAVANYSAEMMEGSSVTLTCSSDANPAANYTWYKEQTVVSRQQQVFIRSMNSSDSGEYHCTAENELGRRTSESISVDVKYAPKLPSVSVSPSAEIVEGSSVTLTCSSDANPEANYTWYKENKSLFHGSVGEHSFSVHSKHSGNYFCKAENQHGQTNSSSLFIDVQYAPKLPSVSVSPSAEIVEGSSVTLTCSSDANPAAKYTWYKEDEDSPKASGQNFTITDVRHEHSGSYYCEAKNRRGRQNSTSCQINIASSVNSAAVGSITVLFLTLLILSAIIVIRKRRSLTQFFSRERPNSKVQQSVCPKYEDPSAAAQSAAAEQQEDLCYASVSFSKNQDDPVYSNIKPTKPSRQKEEDEEEAEYTLVKFSNGAQGLRGQQAVEDSCALYSTVNKIC